MMTGQARVRSIGKHLAVGLLVPAVLLANAFIVPEPHSHPLIHVAIAPAKLMPLLENRELMRELTMALFGRMTPNYAPIQIVFLVTFWFLVGLAGSVAFSKFCSRSRA